MVADWGSIPIELATKIVEHAKFYEDSETFKFVSSHWRSAAKQAKFRGSVTVLWLLLPEYDKSSTTRRLYSINTHKSRHFDIPSNSIDNITILSSRGWLLFVSSEGENITLLEPLSDTTIQVPGLYDKLERGQRYSGYNGGRTTLFEKFILSANPSTTSSFTIAMILTEQYNGSRENVIVFWNNVNNNKDNNIQRVRFPSYIGGIYCHDICFYRGQWYAAGDVRDIWKFDLTLEIPDVWLDMNLGPKNKNHYYLHYLVELGGRLLHVSRIHSKPMEGTHRKTTFEILELNLDDETVTRVEDLGTRSIFLSPWNSSFSIEAASTYGFKPNCVYYTDDVPRYENGVWSSDQARVYDLANGTDSFCEGTPHFNKFTRITRMMWVESLYPESQS